MTLRHHKFPVSAVWLADHPADDDVHAFETTVIRHLTGGGSYRVGSGTADRESGRIPRAGLLALQADFSDNGKPLRYMAPTPKASAEAAGRHGIAESSTLAAAGSRLSAGR